MHIIHQLKRFKNLLLYLLGAIFFSWFLMRIPVDLNLLHKAFVAHWPLFLLAYLYYLLKTVLRIIRFALLMRNQDCHPPLISIIEVTFIGLFLAQITPGRMGDLLRFTLIKNDKPKIASIVLFEKICDTLAQLSFSLLGILIITQNLQRNIIVMIVVLALAGFISILFYERLVALTIKVIKWEKLSKLRITIPYNLKLLSILIGFINIILTGGFAVALAKALELPLSISELVCVRAVVDTLATFSGIPGGMGINQLSFTYFLQHTPQWQSASIGLTLISSFVILHDLLLYLVVLFHYAIAFLLRFRHLLPFVMAKDAE